MNRLGSFDYVLCHNRPEAITQTQTALKQGYTQIVALGGDGTLNAVVNGFFEKDVLINADAVLGVTNLGSGCDYYRAIASGRDWKSLVIDFTPQKVDLGKIEFLNQKSSAVYFINMASIGMSAAVVQDKSFSYTLSALKVLPTFKAVAMHLNANGKSIEGKFLNVFVAKGNTAGGGMKLGGNVSFDDGKFDVTLVHQMPLWKSLFKFPKLFTGQFAGDHSFSKITASSIDIHASKKMPVEFDGEIQGFTDIKITVVPQSVRVAFPIH